MGIDFDCRKKNMRLLTIIFLFFTTSCFAQRDKIDYVIFGVYCGECVGHCATMFKLEGDKMMVDTSNSYFWNNMLKRKDTISFSKYEASKEMYQYAKALIDSIPTILLDTNTHSCTFGEPDARDQCGIYLEFKYKGKQKQFYIDTDSEYIPVWLLKYKASIENTVNGFYKMVWGR
jgi:hypothetical protein